MKSTTTHHLLLWFAFLGGLSHPTAAGPRVLPGARTPAARMWERRGSCTGDGHRQWCWGHQVPPAMNLPPRSFLVLWCPSWSCPAPVHALDSFKMKLNQRVRCRRRADALCRAGGWPASGDKASRSPCCRTTAVCWEQGQQGSQPRHWVGTARPPGNPGKWGAGECLGTTATSCTLLLEQKPGDSSKVCSSLRRRGAPCTTRSFDAFTWLPLWVQTQTPGPALWLLNSIRHRCSTASLAKAS